MPGPARPWSVPLGSALPPTEVLARLRAEDQPACLWGNWFEGAPLIARRPLRWLAAGEDPIEAVGELPSVPPGAGAGGVATGRGPALLGGGWIGSIGFDPGSSLLGFYDAVLRLDPSQGWVFETLGLPGREATMERELLSWRTLLSAAGATPTTTSTPAARWRVGTFGAVLPGWSVREGYLAAVEEAIGQIRRGDYYQVNICTRLRTSYEGDPLSLFAATAAELRPGLGGFIGTADRAVVSLSPELFLRVRGRGVVSAPIKGTAPRRSGEVDSPLLRASAKDAAENIMIVDLVRNDLSRVCSPGTVVVDDLLAVEPHPGVWHLVSTVSGELADGMGLSQLLRATFPPGSVTGAPKSSALEGIARLEPVRRRAYTGAFGMVSPIAGSEFSVLIRSFELEAGQLDLGVGGGITVDSVPMLEWRECLHKAQPLVAAAGSTLASELSPVPADPTPEQLSGGIFESLLAYGPNVLRLSDHLARLERSCRELWRTGIPETLATDVRAAAARGRPERRQRIRVRALPDSTGTVGFSVTSSELGPRTRSSAVVITSRPDPLWRHKWNDRSVLEAAEATAAAAGALPLFVAQDGTVLETTRGNIVWLTPDRVVVTPPLRDDLLPGVTRRALLDLLPRLGLEHRIAPGSIDDLRAARAAYWTSALSGVVIIDHLDGRPLPVDEALADRLNAALGFIDRAGDAA
ncbi:hypothetical protein GCM10009841_22990 [Microlunatus panaciterrae]